jgi:hypothetical protein
MADRSDSGTFRPLQPLKAATCVAGWEDDNQAAEFALDAVGSARRWRRIE